MLDIFIQCPQCHICNSGKINRYDLYLYVSCPYFFKICGDSDLYLFLQAVSESSQVTTQDDPSSSQADQNVIRSDAKFNYEMSVEGQTLHRDYLGAHVHQDEEPKTVIPSSTVETQVLRMIYLFSIIYYSWVWVKY